MSPGRIALGYAVIAILWIAFSDAVVTYLKLHPALMTIKGGVFVVVTAWLLYITIRRLVQTVQRTSQERDETAELYRTVVEASNEGICLLDESGRISFLNGRLAAMLGRPAEELQGERLQNFIEEPNVLAQPGARQSETRECRLRKDSDPKPWVLISRRSFLNDAGDIVGLVVTVVDITEPKWAEKPLRRSEAYLAEVPEAAENLRERERVSPARYGLAILSVAIALGASLLLQHFHFRVPAALLLLFAVAISSWFGGRGPAILAAILSTIGFYWYFVEPVRTVYIFPSEIPYFITFVTFAALLSWFGAFRRRVEAGLREQAALLNLTHDTVFVMDMEGVIKYWNRGAEEQYGWSAEQAVGKVAYELLKTVLPVPFEGMKSEMTRTGRWEGELLHTNKYGAQLVVASRWSLQRDRHGAPFAILETNNDISERKRAEEALSRLNRDLRAISYCNQALLRATDEQSLLKEICRIVCEEAGYRMAWVAYAEHDEAKSVRPVAWTGTDEGYLTNLGITWADSERGRGPTGTAIRSGKTCCVQDFATDPLLAPWRESDLLRDFRSGIALPLKDEHANPFGSLTIYSSQPNAFTPEEIRLLEELAGDMAFGIVTLRSGTARKKAEQEVSLLSFAMNNIREAALLIDETARIHYVNDEACRVLGYTRAELLGMSIPDIDPELPAGRWSDHWHDLKAQRSLSFESRHRTKDGRIFPVEVSANYFEYGGQAYNLGLVRDISERKRAEEVRLEERVSERTRIARELHDTLLQSFHGVLLLFQAGRNLVRPHPQEAEEILDNALDQAQQAIAEGRDAIQNMRSSATVTNDLEAAVQAVGNEFASEHGPTFKVIVKGWPRDLHPILRDEIHQIAREAIRNAFRHAQAKLIEAEIIYGDDMRLRVRDDGKGIDPQIVNEGRPGHYGIPGMRERAAGIGAELEVCSSPGAGTQIELRIPGLIAYGNLPKRDKPDADGICCGQDKAKESA